MKFAIIGLGFISQRHVSAIAKNGGVLEWVCDVDQKKLDEFDSHDVKKTANYMDIKDIDYAVICAPNHLHADLIRHFTGLGIKVIVEKPPVLNINDFQGLENRDISVMLQLRYHPEMQRLKEFAKEGNHQVKMIVRVKRDQTYWNSWKGDKEKSGGILFNLGIHYLDALFESFEGEVRIKSSILGDDRALLNLSIGTNDIMVLIEIADSNEKQTREIIIGSENFQFSKKDNLSFEDLHAKAYEEILAGRGISLKSVSKLMHFLFLCL